MAASEIQRDRPQGHLASPAILDFSVQNREEQMLCCLSAPSPQPEARGLRECGEGQTWPDLQLERCLSCCLAVETGAEGVLFPGER